jgi:chemotaxis protein histidine kinase CheA
MAKLTTGQDLELRRLRRLFLTGLPERVRHIEAALQRVLAARGADPDPIEDLFHLAHSLCGSSGIYGHAAVHVAAGVLEGATLALRDARAGQASREALSLAPLVQALGRASVEPPASSHEPAESGLPTRPRGRRHSGQPARRR